MLASRCIDVRPMVEQFRCADGRRLFLLAEGRLVNLAAAEGHPAAVMDMSFANQALCGRARGPATDDELERRVYMVPQEIDAEIARLKLESLGVDDRHAHRGAGALPRPPGTRVPRFAGGVLPVALEPDEIPRLEGDAVDRCSTSGCCLPERVERSLHDWPPIAEAIREMVVRGAPAIGIAAAYGVALAARARPAGGCVDAGRAGLVGRPGRRPSTCPGRSG